MLRRAFLSLCLALPMTAFSAEPPPPGEHAMTYVSELDQTEQPYNLFVPSAISEDRPLPLLVVLHGKGADWRAWFLATNVTEWAEREGYIVAAPQGRGDWFYLGPGERDVHEVIRDVRAQLPVDPDRAYLMGHSMGGWGAWSLGTANPDLFAAIIPMAGWCPRELLVNLENTPPFVIHGGADDVVPWRESRRAAEELSRLGVNHRFLEVDGAGHESSMISHIMPAAFAWMNQHRRSGPPMKLALQAYVPHRGQAWWLEMRAIDPFLALGKLRGRIADDGAIHVEVENVPFFAIHPQHAPLPEEAAPAVVINGERFDLTAADFQGTIPVARDENGRWVVPANNPFYAEQYAEEVVIEMEALPEDVPQAVADLIRDRVGAEVVLLNRDLLRLPAHTTTITRTMLADLALRGEDQLVRFRMDAGELRDLLDKRPEQMPAWWGDVVRSPQELPEEGDITVVVPALMAPSLPGDGQAIGSRLRGVVYEAWKGEGR